uniref:Uncharacterized protein n=1 Tax=Monopterus albus TaxID=43700 RepID=A0A3Q3PZ43_MONAL
MKTNQNTLLERHKVVLVPYNANHVPCVLSTCLHSSGIMNGWMKCPELQHLSASEPPTLEQEYDMQWSWREDGNSKTSSAVNVNAEHCTVGDVNMFLTDPTDLSSAEQISTVSLCCGLYISVISYVYLFIFGQYYIPLDPIFHKVSSWKTES